MYHSSGSMNPQAYRRTEFIHQRGLASARPAAADVLPGTLYFSTDTSVLERSTGITWESYVNQGTWISVPYNAANFTVEQGTMVWTVTAGNQAVFDYVRINPHVIILNLTLLSTTLSGTGLDTLVLNVALPFIAATSCLGTAMLEDNGLRSSGIVQLSVGTSKLRIYRNF